MLEAEEVCFCLFCAACAECWQSTPHRLWFYSGTMESLKDVLRSPRCYDGVFAVRVSHGAGAV